jgi:hypothetical protein
VNDTLKPLGLWQRSWREHVAPNLSIAGLAALKTALETNDKRLLQKVTVLPDGNGRVSGACVIGYCGWQETNNCYCRTPYAVDRYYTEVCRKIHASSGWEAIHFITWYDKTPRQEMIAALLPEVELVLSSRLAKASSEAPASV